MPTWQIEDDCLAPNPQIIINYKGKNPFEVYRRISKIMKNTLQITSSKYFENEFRWDMSSDPRTFFVRVYGKTTFDNRTYGWYEVILQGAQPSDPNKVGWLTIKLSSKLKTKYDLNTAFQQTPFYRALIKIYNRLFYFKIRRRHLELCRRFTNELEKNIRDLLNEISK